MKDFLYFDEHQIILAPIINRRFFDREKCNFYLNETFVQPKFTTSDDKTFWKRYYPNIQDGDIIYVTKCDKFIQINLSKLFVRYKWDNECSRKKYNPILPIDYWKEVGIQHPFRLWITVKVYYESLKNWMTNPNIHFIDLDLDPKLYMDDREISICFTYVGELIYIYKGRN
jgi:hypothetical protein